MKIKDTEVFLLDITNIDKDDLKRFEKYISKDRLEKSKNYRFKEDFIRSMCAELLILFALKKYKIFLKPEFQINNYNKPELKNNKDFKFNITHSGKYVAIAVSDKEVGIDIELIQKGLRGIADTIFSETERNYLINLSNDMLDDLIIKIWTMKESYSKYTGKGIVEGFSEFSILPNSYKVIDKKENVSDVYIFNEKLSDNYYISVCHKKSKVKINEVNLKELIDNICII